MPPSQGASCKSEGLARGRRAENMKNVNCGTERNAVTRICDLGAGEDQELKPAAARLRTGGQLGLHETNSKTKPEKMRGNKRLSGSSEASGEQDVFLALTYIHTQGASKLGLSIQCLNQP